MGAAYSRDLLDGLKKVRLPVFALSSFLIILITILNEKYGSSEVQKILFGYDSVLVIIHSISIFLIVIDIHPMKLFRVLLLKLADASFGIYVIHMIFVNAIYKFLRINPFIAHGVTGGY